MTGLRPRRTEYLYREADAMNSTDRGNRASGVLAATAVWTLDLSGTTIEFRTRSFGDSRRSGEVSRQSRAQPG
jgi:hypothetical protein